MGEIGKRRKKEINWKAVVIWVVAMAFIAVAYTVISNELQQDMNRTQSSHNAEMDRMQREHERKMGEIWKDIRETREETRRIKQRTYDEQRRHEEWKREQGF